MSHFFNKLVVFVLVFFISNIVVSQTTVIHDIYWHSDTVGLWGDGSSAWSINQVDTLADITVGPYSDHFSMVYNIPFPISDSVGVIFDYGAFADLQLIFAMTGWDNGSAKIDYPTKITMDLPADGSLSNGSWETIPSEYRVHDTIVHPTDEHQWEIYADWPDAGIIHLFLNIDLEANADLIYSDPTDPLNITWDTLNVFEPIDIHLDTFDIFLIDMINNEYAIPWVDYHTDPFTGETVIDSVYILQDSLGWPLVFPPIFYDLIGISGDISIPSIQNYTKWVENEQRLYTWGNDEYMHINLDIIQFLQVTTDYLSNIPSMEGLAVVSQALQYEEGDTSIYIFTDPVSGEDFSANLTWDLIDAELMFTNTMNQTLSFVDDQEYTFFGFPIGPDHYPNVWNIFEFPLEVEYKVLDTIDVVVDSGVSDSIKFCADYDLELRLPCNDFDTLPVTISHTIDPWFTNMVRDSIDVEFYLKILELVYSIGTPSNPILDGNFLLFEDTFDLGTIAGPPLFGPPIFMPWMIDGYFIDTTFVPDAYIIPENDPLGDSLIYSDVLCYGTSTGSILAIGTGGSPPYTYLWEDEIGVQLSTIDSLTDIGVGIYYLTITDANDCELVDSVFLINTNPQIILSEDINHVFCFGDSTGSATINVFGGTPPYQYTWLPNIGNTQTITQLTAGTYYLTVTDDIACSEYDTIVIINQNPPISITTQQLEHVTCFDGVNGLIDIEVSGGVAPYHYYWTNGSITQDINNVSAGTYSVTVSDDNACLEISSWDILEPDEIVITSNLSQNISCHGGNNGAIDISVVGGTGGYTYLWETLNGSGIIQGQQNQTGLIAGQYNLTITDDNNCVKTESWVLTEPDALQIVTEVQQDVKCFGGNDGTINVSISGGTNPFSYHWQTSNGSGILQNAQNQNTLTIGTYQLTVTDGNNCQDSSSWTIYQPEPLDIISIIKHLDCNGDSDGEISVEGTGGIAPYLYTWSANGGGISSTGSQTINNLYADSYYLTLTDDNMCTIVKELVVSEPNALAIAVISDYKVCQGDSVDIEMSATGGLTPYTYYWNGQLSSDEITVYADSDTTLIATAIDINGCHSNVESVNVSLWPSVELFLLEDSIEVCEGGEITINTALMGGVEPYIYTDLLGTILTTPINYTPDQTGVYTILVQDACQTKSSASVFVDVNHLPNISISVNDNKGCEPLELKFINNNPEVGVNYIWNFGDNTPNSGIQNPIHTYQESGVYSVNLTAISENHCISEASLATSIYVRPTPTAQFSFLPLRPSSINSMVEFKNISEGASSYFWSFGDGSLSEDENPIHRYKETGYFDVQLTAISNFGCIDTLVQVIDVRELCTFYAPTAFSPDNDYKNDYFYISGTGIEEEDFLLIVYNRWGEVIWQTNIFDKDSKESEGWNGIAKKHKIVENGVYKWLASYKDVNGKKHEKTGRIVLIR